MTSLTRFPDDVAALIVEDDPAVVDAIEAILADEGIPSVSVGTVAGARALIERGGVGVVLLDLDLGEDTDRGRFLLDDLAGHKAAPPMVIVSGYREGPAVAAEFAIPFVPKPFDVAELTSAVAVARRFELRPQPPRRNASAKRSTLRRLIDKVSSRPPRRN